MTGKCLSYELRGFFFHTVITVCCNKSVDGQSLVEHMKITQLHALPRGPRSFVFLRHPTFPVANLAHSFPSSAASFCFVLDGLFSWQVAQFVCPRTVGIRLHAIACPPEYAAAADVHMWKEKKNAHLNLFSLLLLFYFDERAIISFLGDE